MSSNDIQLRALVFRVDFQLLFDLIDKRGQIATEFKKSDLFENVGVSKDTVSIGTSASEPYMTLDCHPDNINGRMEKASINVEDAVPLLKFASSLFNSLKISTDTINRIGIRFLYVRSEEDFAVANQKILTLYSKNVFEVASKCSIDTGGIFDSYIAFRYSKDDYRCRILMGPLSEDEYYRWFRARNIVREKSSILTDADYYVSQYKYKDLHLERIMQEAYERSSLIVREFYESLK